MTIYYDERDIPDWPEWTERGAATRLDGVPEDETRAVFYREKASHKGIAARQRLEALIATKVNRDFFDEICALPNLRYLELHDVTVEDLSPLTSLRNLRTLKLTGVRKATEFAPLLTISGLERLFIENAKHLEDLDFLAQAHHLRSIGIEGGMWAVQKVASLKPLSGLAALEALFMVATRLEDKDLSVLASCPKLRILQCARFAPKPRFDELGTLMPDLECQWCDDYEV